MTFDIDLSPLQQRALAIALALLPLLAVGAGMSTLLADRSLHHERLALVGRELARYQTLVRNAPGWQGELQSLEGSAQSAGLFTAGNNAANATGQIESSLSNILTRNDATNLRITPASAGNASEIVMNVAFSARIADLARILYELRSSRPLLVPLRLEVHSQIPVAPASAATTAPNILGVELVVAGFVRPS